MALTPGQISRSQARLAVVEHLLVNLGSLYEVIATGTVAEPQLLAVFTTVIEDEKADIDRLLTSLDTPGSDSPIDQPAATQGRLRIEQAKAVLSYLQHTLPRLATALHTDEDGRSVADLTTEQREALGADIARAIAKLQQAIADA